SDVRVITLGAYRLNGAGYNDLEHPNHLWLVDLAAGSAAGTPRRLTSGPSSDGEPVWSRDGRQIYFTVDRVKESYYAAQRNELDAVPAAGGEPVKIVGFDCNIGPFAVSPDGRSIAFVGTQNAAPVRSYDEPDLFVVASAPGSSAKNLTTGYDFDVTAGGNLAGDQHAPRGAHPSRPVWSADGRSIVVSAIERGRVNLHRFDAATGKETAVTTGDHEVVAFNPGPSAAKLAVVVSTPTEIGDLFWLDAASGKLARLTSVNRELWSELKLTPPDDVTYPSFDGRTIEAW